MNKGKVEETRARREGKKQRLRRLSGKVRDPPFPLSQFIDLGEPRSRELRAPRTLTAGNAVCR
jgi:hypothetical protein